MNNATKSVNTILPGANSSYLNTLNKQHEVKSYGVSGNYTSYSSSSSRTNSNSFNSNTYCVPGIPKGYGTYVNLGLRRIW